MPKADSNGNFNFARKDDGGENMATNDKNKCNCDCNKPEYPNGYWCPPPVPGCPPPPVPGCPPAHGCCPPYPPYPYPCPPDAPVAPSGNSTEAQIAKLSKKSAIVRKQIEALTVKKKPIMISIGGVSYNYGTYLNADGETTDYGEAIKTILQTELEAIKAKIIELTQDLDAETTPDTGVEGTVTL